MATANPTASIIVFLVLTLAYFIFKYYTKSDQMIKIWSIIYFLLLIVIQFAINVGLTNEICGFTQYTTAIKSTLIPWIFIFGTFNILLMIFPNWLTPFSNTIGYFVSYLSGINHFFKNILVNEDALKSGDNQKGLIKAIDNVYLDKSLLINAITMQNLPQWWDSMKKGNMFKGNVGDEQYETLKSFIKMKTEVAQFIWFVLVGTLVSSMSYNSIVNSGCVQSASTMEQRHNDYMEKENKINEDKQNSQSQQTIYKAYE